MKPNPQFSADLVTFTEEILNGKLDFLCSDMEKLVLIHTSLPPLDLQIGLNANFIVRLSLRAVSSTFFDNIDSV